MDNDAKLIDSAEIEELQDRIEALESDQAMVTQRRFLMTTDCSNSLNFAHAKSALR